MILILGGGLAGMSTAYHLGDRPHLVVEGESVPGGLCRSRDIDGFIFDYTGHLLHLRDERAKALVDDLLPGAFSEIERKARIRMRGVTLPFPFQANLHGLPKPVVADALVGFVESLGRPVPDAPRTSFEEWSLAVFGRGISDLFMLPYNHKLFRRQPADMTADWVSWAVPKPTLEELVRGALGIENQGMGYNATFRYPREGGIGILPEALSRRVENMRLGQKAVEVDLDRRTVTLSGGERLDYERLVVTIPLPAFLRMARGGAGDRAGLADRLDWSVVACVNLGVDRAELADGAHWLYVPDKNVPFYRVGFPSTAAGLMAWTAWADAAAEARRLSDVAAAGPIAAIVGAPLFSWLTELGRDDAVFLGMAALAVVPLVLPMRLDAVERKGKRRISPSRSNRILLLALTAMTLCGSALFIYAAAAAQDLSGLSVTAASGAYSLNAAGGFVGTRMSRRGSAASPWVAVIGVSLLAVVLLESAPVFYLAMTIWGFAFWMAVPRVLRLLALRSFSPDERIGDAQAGMAVGRAIGPAAGAGFASSSRFTALGVLAASGMALAASAVGGVELFRRRGGDADVHPKEPMQRWRLPTPRKAA